MKKLNDYLPKDEVIEEEAVFTVGDSLLFQFYCGNWSHSVKEMKANNITAFELVEYIEECMEELGYKPGEKEGSYYSWFDRKFFAELGRSVSL